MADLALARSKGDRRWYSLEGVGSLRFGGLLSRRATAEAGDLAWEFARSGFWRQRSRATDAAGVVVGEFQPRSPRRGGSVRWEDRDLELRPASGWRERYALEEASEVRAVLDGKGWGRAPVKVTVDDLNSVDPGLLLFAAFIVRGLADDANAAAVGASTAATGT